MYNTSTCPVIPDQLPAGILLISRAQEIVYQNAQAMRISSEGPVFRALNDTLPPRDLQEMSPWFLLKPGECSRTVVISAMIPGTGEKWYQAECGPYDADEEYTIVSLSDVTVVRQHLHSRMEELNHQLLQAVGELEQFARVASHDLQEPLRMVNGFLHLLEKKYETKLDETGLQYIGYAVEGADRMSVLLDGLLHYSRVMTTPEESLPLDMQQQFDKALAQVRRNHPDKKIQVSGTKLPMIQARRSQMEQLWFHLLDNAAKFTYPGQDPVIEYGFEETARGWQFYIQDHGIGMDVPEFPGLFHIFQRHCTRRDFPGNGIGLAICKRIIERHEGRIAVISKVGEGSRFRFVIPAEA